MSSRELQEIGVFILLTICVSSSHACSTQKTRQCQFYPLISAGRFNAFIPSDKLDKSCRQLQNALSCAYLVGKLEQCQPQFRLAFDSQRGVFNAICGQRRQDYKSSSKCFSNRRVQVLIDSLCMPALASSELMSFDPCGNITRGWVNKCVTQVVSETWGCDHKDVALMLDLLDIYLQPSKEINKLSALCLAKAGREMSATTASATETMPRSSPGAASSGGRATVTKDGITNDMQSIITQEMSEDVGGGVGGLAEASSSPASRSEQADGSPTEETVSTASESGAERTQSQATDYSAVVQGSDKNVSLLPTPSSHNLGFVDLTKTSSVATDSTGQNATVLLEDSESQYTSPRKSSSRVPASQEIAKSRVVNKKPKSEASTGNWSSATKACYATFLEAWLIAAILFL